MILLEAALHYASLGFPVLPLHTTHGGSCGCGRGDCPSPGKHPRTEHGHLDATTDEVTIREWGRKWPEANVGMRTGTPGGVVVLDVDPRNGGDRALKALELSHGELPRTVKQYTGSDGGVHIFFRHPGPHVSVGSRSGIPVPGVEPSGMDFRGEDGYVVVAPSMHVSGRRYAWAPGQAPGETPFAEMPEWLRSLIQSGVSTRTTEIVPGDARLILEGQRHTTLASLAGTMRRRGMSDAAIAAALKAENTNSCRPQPLPESEVDSIVRSAKDWPRPSSENLRSISLQGEDRSNWQPPVPFSQMDLPEFPTVAFAPWLRDFVEDVAHAAQVPVALPSMLSLSVCAAACAKKVRVRVREGFVEPVSLFTVTVLPPGNRKSSVFREATAPLEEFEEQEIERTRPQIAEAATQRKILEATLDKARSDATKAKGEQREAVIEEAKGLARHLAESKVPTAPRYITDDCSPERLSTLLSEQDGRMAVMSAEGDVFDLMAGRYTRDGSPNFGVYLKGHSGDTLRVDRVGRPAEFVKDPALTMALAVQPEVLRGMVARLAFRGRGLVGRFLYAVPKSLLGYRDTDPPSLPTHVRQSYHDKVRSLLEMPFGTDAVGRPAANILTLSEEGQRYFRIFEKDLEPRLAEFGDLGHMTDWAGKLAGATARMAAILHMAEHADEPAPWGTAISGETVLKAIVIAEFLIEHAKAAYGEMGSDPTVEAARCLLAHIERRSLTHFAKRDLFQTVKGRFRRAADLDPPLELLIEHGHLRPRAGERRQGPGRPPSQVYEVNPCLGSQNSQNPHKSAKATNSEDCGNSETPPRSTQMAAGSRSSDAANGGASGLAIDAGGVLSIPPRPERRGEVWEMTTEEKRGHGSE